MSGGNVGKRPTATVAGVQVRLSRPEWLIISQMITRSAGVERAPHIARTLDRLVRMKMIAQVSVEDAAAPVYAYTPLARAFHAAVLQRASSRTEAKARRAARRLAEQEEAANGRAQA